LAYLITSLQGKAHVGLRPGDLDAAGYPPLYIGSFRLTFNGPPGLTGLSPRGAGLLPRRSRTTGFDSIFSRLAAPSFLKGKQWSEGPKKIELVFPRVTLNRVDCALATKALPALTGNRMKQTIALITLINQAGGAGLAGLTEIFLFFRVSRKTPH
jgi:hypothetical protein